ncbi:MAG: hypothetical protein K5839_06320, partial [Treponemataceae bacterium]|nr:hypothetical protein [Treponemataceae bacterium]
MTSCRDSEPIVIWTNKAEVVSYVELFNASQNESKAVVVYKDNLGLSLPPAKGEKNPDIVIGSGIKNERVRRNFAPIGYLLHNVYLRKASFYESVLEAGRTGGIQYLIPVSFNLPMVIFQSNNAPLLQNDYLISLDELKEISVKYNKKNKNGVYTSMGFAPRWNPEFMYLVARMQGADFKCSDKSQRNFTWNEEKLISSVNYLRNWTQENNESSAIEEDYSFKYLYMPEYKLIEADRCLFEYTTSEVFFNLPEGKNADIDYRWIHCDNKIPIDDDIVFLG